jgi:hypothetical protein
LLLRTARQSAVTHPAAAATQRHFQYACRQGAANPAPSRPASPLKPVAGGPLGR